MCKVMPTCFVQKENNEPRNRKYSRANKGGEEKNAFCFSSASNHLSVIGSVNSLCHFMSVRWSFGRGWVVIIT